MASRWSITPNDTASINSNGKATFRPNTTNTPRKYTVTYTSENGSVCTMEVTQQGNVCSFSYSESSGNIPLTGKTGYVFGTLSNIDGQTITVTPKSSSRQYIDGDMTVNADNKVVGNVKTNDNGQHNIDPRNIEYTISADGVECASYSKTQDGKACACQCSENTLTTDVNTLSWAYNQRQPQDVNITPHCSSDELSFTVDYSTVTHFTVNVSGNKITVTPNGDNTGREEFRDTIKINFSACGNQCTVYAKAITLIQAPNTCSCSNIVYTADTSVILPTATSAVLGRYTVTDNCSYDNVQLRITSDPHHVVNGNTVIITPETSYYSISVNVNPQTVSTEDYTFEYQIMYNNISDNCPTGSKTQKSSIDCDCSNADLVFVQNDSSNHQYDFNKQDITLGYFTWNTAAQHCISDSNVEFVMKTEYVGGNHVMSNIHINNSSGVVTATLPEVTNACATKFGWRFRGTTQMCENRYQLKRICFCPTDNCMIYDTTDAPVYTHPNHVDFEYMTVSCISESNCVGFENYSNIPHITFPNKSDSMFIPSGTIIYKGGDVRRGANITARDRMGHPTLPPTPGEQLIKQADQPGRTGITLIDGDAFTVTSDTDSDMVVTVIHKKADKGCASLSYYASRNGGNTIRDCIINFSVLPDGGENRKLDTNCLNEDDYRDGKYSCQDFTVDIRQSSENHKFIRTCADSFTHDSFYREIPWYYFPPDTTNKKCQELPLASNIVVYCAEEKLSVINDNTFGLHVQNHTYDPGIRYFHYDDLGEVTLQSVVTSVSANAFKGVKKLISIELPSTVTTIGNNAFSGCTGMYTFIIRSTTPPTLGTGVFSGKNTLLKIHVPADKVNTYKNAPGWRDFADIIEQIW